MIRSLAAYLLFKLGDYASRASRMLIDMTRHSDALAFRLDPRMAWRARV